MNITRSFKNRTKTITYSIENCSNNNEQKAIDSYIAFAYNASALVMEKLEKNDKSLLDAIQTIYGENCDTSFLAEAYKYIMESIDLRLKIKRESIFIAEDGKKIKEVLSSANLKSKKIIVYDYLFYDDFEKNNAFTSKIATIFHEIAHLNGFTSDESFGNVHSAECLQNFTLLICNIITKSELKQEEREILIGRNGELPNKWEEQPRAPSGTREGGQWIKEGSKTTPTRKSQKEKTCLNLLSGGIKKDGSNSWSSGNLEVYTEKANTRYSVVVGFEYSYYSAREEKEVTEYVKIAMDAISDDNKKIKIQRVGVLGEYNKDVVKNRFQYGDIKIKVKFYTAEGSVEKNYGIPNKPNDMNDIYSDSNEEDREKYGLGYYSVFHAAQDKWLDTEKPEGYKGGDISGRKDPEHLKQIGEGVIEYVGGETKISGDLLNTAPGRY